MLFEASQIEIPKKGKQIPLGMIGFILLELRKDKWGNLEVITPYASFGVQEETPQAVVRVIEEVIKYFELRHPEHLFAGPMR